MSNELLFRYSQIHQPPSNEPIVLSNASPANVAGSADPCAFPGVYAVQGTQLCTIDGLFVFNGSKWLAASVDVEHSDDSTISFNGNRILKANTDPNSATTLIVNKQSSIGQTPSQISYYSIPLVVKDVHASLSPTTGSFVASLGNEINVLTTINGEQVKPNQRIGITRMPNGYYVALKDGTLIYTPDSKYPPNYRLTRPIPFNSPYTLTSPAGESALGVVYMPSATDSALTIINDGVLAFTGKSLYSLSHASGELQSIDIGNPLSSRKANCLAYSCSDNRLYFVNEGKSGLQLSYLHGPRPYMSSDSFLISKSATPVCAAIDQRNDLMLIMLKDSAQLVVMGARPRSIEVRCAVGEFPNSIAWSPVTGLFYGLVKSLGSVMLYEYSLGLSDIGTSSFIVATVTPIALKIPGWAVTSPIIIDASGTMYVLESSYDESLGQSMLAIDLTELYLAELSKPTLAPKLVELSSIELSKPTLAFESPLAVDSIELAEPLLAVDLTKFSRTILSKSVLDSGPVKELVNNPLTNSIFGAPCLSIVNLVTIECGQQLTLCPDAVVEPPLTGYRLVELVISYTRTGLTSIMAAEIEGIEVDEWPGCLTYFARDSFPVPKSNFQELLRSVVFAGESIGEHEIVITIKASNGATTSQSVFVLVTEPK
jgi:hypothetical protein